jgi:hypothetical protein
MHKSAFQLQWPTYQDQTFIQNDLRLDPRAALASAAGSLCDLMFEETFHSITNDVRFDRRSDYSPTASAGR